MEEQKSKEVKLGVAKSNEEDIKKEFQKPTYEQLNNAFMELSQQNNLLRQRLQQAEKYIGTINRLDYLIKMMELANGSSTYKFNADFVLKCIEEIESLMTLSEEDTEDKAKEE